MRAHSHKHETTVHIRRAMMMLAALLVLAVKAQTTDYSCWMSKLDDRAAVARLSIPGAHNAATGEGLRINAGFGKTQALTLGRLWDCGIRAFDLRPAMDGSTLHIYHGPLKTRITLREAIDTIAAKIKQHPREFAIILIRKEKGSHEQWAEAVGMEIERLGEMAAHFTPAMTVADMRGKILFMSRDRYTGSRKGATISGWSHAGEGSTAAKISSPQGEELLQVQDYYNSSGKERQNIKSNAIIEFMEHAGNAAADTWTINFVSAYSTSALSPLPLATNASYKRNATVQHAIAIGELSKRRKDERRPTGIVFIDYAGMERTRGSIWHWGRYSTQSDRLIQLVIEQNF